MMREFTVGGQTAHITCADLEDIRQVVVDRLSAWNDEARTLMIDELQGAVLVLDPENSRLGPWVLTVRREKLALVRIPPRTTVNCLFVVVLSRENDRWVVNDFFNECLQAR